MTFSLALPGGQNLEAAFPKLRGKSASGAIEKS
jgi:hypothetical protein